MRIAFLGGIFPKENLPDILSCSRGVVQSAADALQKSLLQGIGAIRDDVDIINLPFIGSFPKRYSKLLSPIGHFEIKSIYGKKNKLLGRNVRFINLSFFKYYFIYHSAKTALNIWANNYKEYKVIIIYSLFGSFLKAAIDIKNTHPKTKIICIVPDLPQFMSAGGNSTIRQWYQKRSIKNIERLTGFIDAFVILSPYMHDALKIGNRPYAIIEGIYNIHDEKTKHVISSNKNKTIVYAGTLAQRYGIMHLVEAFQKIRNDNVELIICGEGDAKPLIEKFAGIDKRIKLTGNIAREKVLDLIKSASVLVNPRTPEGEFTKYSFPSKTMEYIASGVPTILYKLPGIPIEYYNHCIALTDLSTDTLCNALIDVLSWDEEKRSKFGNDARDFILKEKNPEIQTKKLVQLIDIL